MPMITKYKLNDLAKDLKLNANDIIECLAHQYGAKKTVSSLTPEEVNYVLEVFSQKHQVENFNAYFADKTATKKAKEEPKAEKPKKEAPKAEPKKEEPKKEAPKAEVKKEQPKKEAPKPEVKKEEPT
ncbi:MAG: translation initiation factor IF-2 N-terminal domain-containing protein, partial [Oscillospiraceae bacterium]|nr:translation initiation factor IF-2 N-terminal domain-containing protein [Oscillospiraceae bacterium]